MRDLSSSDDKINWKWFQLESRTIEKALSKVGERGDDDDGLSLLKSFGYSIKQITLLLKE